jgi:hypothetical protein
MSLFQSVLALADFVEQLRYDGEQVADDAEVGDFEDGDFGVFVDGDDGLEVCRPSSTAYVCG